MPLNDVLAVGMGVDVAKSYYTAGGHWEAIYWRCACLDEPGPCRWVHMMLTCFNADVAIHDLTLADVQVLYFMGFTILLRNGPSINSQVRSRSSMSCEHSYAEA